MAAAGRALRSLVALVVGLAAFFALWELAIVVFDIPAFELPPPSRILEAIADDPSFYLRNAWVTGREATLGFALALLLALLAGTVMTYSRFLERAVQPVAVLIQVTPIIAYAPAFVIWLGAGIKPIIAITTLVCFVPFLFNAVAGLRSVDTGHARGAPQRERQRPGDLLAPAPPPRPAVPVRRGAHRRRASPDRRGAGRVVRPRRRRARRRHPQGPQLQRRRSALGSILVLGFLGGSMLLLLSLVERVALHWHPSQVTLSGP